MRRAALFVSLALLALPLRAQIDFTQWHDPAEVDAILDDFVADHPTLALVTTIGTSYEGRPIRALKISDNPMLDEAGEGDLVIMATQHAREWITTETALFIAEQLLTRYPTDPQIQADVNNLQIYIVPVSNPDGFAYTQTPVNRYWRKTRRPNDDNTVGTDPNRNWGFQWGLGPTPDCMICGSSPVPGAQTYRGPFPWSEPEVKAMRDFLNSRPNLKAAINYHAFGEWFLRPWSYTKDDPGAEPILDAVGDRSIARIADVHGHMYNSEYLYTSSGETTDWIWNGKRAASFTPEVRPPYGNGDVSNNNPPTAEIIPNGEENTAAALALIHDAAARELWIRDYEGDTGAEPSAVWDGTKWSAPFWTSPDITTVPATLDQGATVTLNVRVHNNAGVTRTNVRVDAWFNDPSISLEFPHGQATPIGSQTGLAVPPGGLTVAFEWKVPVGTNGWGERHWCVGAIVMHERDMPLTTRPHRSSNVAYRNFATTETVVAKNLVIAATNFLGVDAELHAHIDTLALPAGWQATLPAPPPQPSGTLTTIERKALLLNATGRLLRPGETIYIPIRVVPRANAPSGASADIVIHGALLPLVPGRREALGNGFTYRVVVR